MTERRRTLAEDVVIGAASGIAAAWVMNQFQNAYNQITSPRDGSGADSEGGPKSESATVTAADKLALAITGSPVPPKAKAAAGETVHYGFGTVVGAVYGAVGSLVPDVRAGFGAGYGAAVALIADEALVPAAGLSPPPNEVPPGSHIYGFVSHLVFGAALEGSRRLVGAALDSAQDRSADGQSAR